MARLVYLQDGDKEVVTQDELDVFTTKFTAIPIGEKGMPFIKKFQGTWYTGVVVRVLDNESECVGSMTVNTRSILLLS